MQGVSMRLHVKNDKTRNSKLQKHVWISSVAFIWKHKVRYYRNNDVEATAKKSVYRTISLISSPGGHTTDEDKQFKETEDVESI